MIKNVLDYINNIYIKKYGQIQVITWADIFISRDCVILIRIDDWNKVWYEEISLKQQTGNNMLYLIRKYIADKNSCNDNEDEDDDDDDN